MTGSIKRGTRLTSLSLLLTLLLVLTPLVGSATPNQAPDNADRVTGPRVDPLVEKTTQPPSPDPLIEHVLTPQASTPSAPWTTPPTEAAGQKPSPRTLVRPAKAVFEPVFIHVRRRVTVRRRIAPAARARVTATVSRKGRRRVSLASRGGHTIVPQSFAAPSPVSATPRYHTVVTHQMVSLDISPIILKYAERYRVDPYLIKAVISVESQFHNQAVSHAGARGLMQLMPGTGRGMGARDLHDPEQNIAAGTRYLRAMLDRYSGRWECAIAAYNAGPGNVSLRGGIPNITETRHYVVKVLRTYKAFSLAQKPQKPTQAAAAGPSTSPGWPLPAREVPEDRHGPSTGAQD